MKKKDDTIILDTLDPLNRQVVMYSSTWYGHILKRDDKEEDKVQDVKEVQEAITNPNIIGTTYNIESRQIYYRYREDESKYTAVIVELNDPSFVVTSFKTQRLRIRPPYIYVSSTSYGGMGGGGRATTQSNP